MIFNMLNDFRFWRQLGYMTIAATAACVLCGCANNQSEDQPDNTAANTTPTLDTIQTLGESGSQLGQFLYPRGMDIYTIDNHPFAAIVDKTARIQTMDLATGNITGAIHTPRWDRGKPTGLTVSVSVLDPDQLALYVADTHEHRVLMYHLPLPYAQIPEPTEPDFMFGSFGHEPGQFVYPTDIAIETDDHGAVDLIYVSEYGGNDRISRFKIDHTTSPPTLNFEHQLGTPSEEVDASDGPVALSRPQSIELWTNPQGQREILLTDASHHRVGRISTNGDLIAWYGDPLDTTDDAYRFPYGLTALDDGTAIITEFGGNRVRCIDIESGTTLWRYGSGGRSIGQLAQPWATGVIEDQLVILDSMNSRLQICKLPKGVKSIGNEYTNPQQLIGGNNP